MSEEAEKVMLDGFVRETFVRGREQHADFNGINNSRKEFERWLAARDAELERQIQGWVRSATEAKDAHRSEVEALAAERDALRATLDSIREWMDDLVKAVNAFTAASRGSNY